MGPNDLLTVLFPTRNRPHNIAGQLRLFEQSNLPVLVADSSDPENVAAVAAATAGKARFFYCSPTVKFFDKLADAINRIEAPFIVLAADRKITFPHSIMAALKFAQDHEDCICAMGYVVGFGRHEDDIDINRVVFFTPTIDGPDPLARHYQLMRRYQSWQFALFRTEPLRNAVAHARTVEGVLFQEIMFMNALVLQGKLARLPSIFALQTVEQSFSGLRNIDPMYWFLHDSRSFFRHYVRYRSSLARLIFDSGMTRLALGDLVHYLDAVHALWLNYNFDQGVLNFAVQQMLSGRSLNLPYPRPPLLWQNIRPNDVVHSGRGTHRFIWRSEVLNAEPRDEIQITPSEIELVEAQLDTYFGH